MNAESSRSHSIFTIYIETAEDVSYTFQKLNIGWLWNRGAEDKGWKVEFG
jgi:hypothetical protein